MGLILDGVIAILLLTTISYCWKLNSRINLLRQGRQEMNQFLVDFNHSIQRAEWNIGELKQHTETADETLRAQLDKAKILNNDLSFLIDRAENIADVLEQYIKHTRNLQRSLMEEMQQSSAPRPAAARRPATPENAVTIAARNNAVLQRPHNAASAPVASTRPTSTTQRPVGQEPQQTAPVRPASQPTGLNPVKRHALESLLEQIAARKAAANKPMVQPQPQPAAQRTVDAEERPQGLRARAALHDIQT